MAANHVLLALHRQILVAYLLPGRIYGLNLHVGNTTSSCSSSPYMKPGGPNRRHNRFSQLLFALSACFCPYSYRSQPHRGGGNVGEILFPSPSAWDKMERRWQKVTFAS